MQSRRIRLGFAVAILLALSSSARPQDGQTWADAYVKGVDAEVADYLQKHPLRPSPLFTTVSFQFELLGRTKAATIEECEYEPDFPDFEKIVPYLRENTVVALRQRFAKGLALAPRREGPRVGRSLCAELKRQYKKILRGFQEDGPALRKLGY